MYLLHDPPWDGMASRSQYIHQAKSLSLPEPPKPEAINEGFGARV